MKKLILIAILSTSLFAWGHESVARQVLKHRLNDVDSAKFDGVYRFNSGVVCGKVNAKNGYGAYTGYRRFIGKGTLVFFQSDMTSRDEFVKAWNSACKE